MSKGIKMRSALDDANRQQSLQSLQQLADTGQPIPTLRCDGKNCLTPVRFVPQRLDPNKENAVRAAYIGLKSSAASDHTATCDYNALAQLNSILAQSDRNFIKALNAGASELRLLLMHNKLGGVNQPQGSAPASAAGGSPAKGNSNNYRPSAMQLNSYLRTTADILKLRERCEEDDLLQTTLVLSFGNKKISWSEFYFEHGRYEDAWAMADSRKDACHPFAIMGTVEQFRPPAADAQYPTGWLDLHTERNKPNANNTANTYSINVGDKNWAWLSLIPAGSKIIVFGVWKVTPPKKSLYNVPSDPPREITYFNHTLTLYPKFHAQLLVI